MDSGLNVIVALLSSVCYQTIDRIDFESVVVVAVVAYMTAFDGFDFVSEAISVKCRIIVVINLVSLGSCFYPTN